MPEIVFAGTRVAVATPPRNFFRAHDCQAFRRRAKGSELRNLSGHPPGPLRIGWSTNLSMATEPGAGPREGGPQELGWSTNLSIWRCGRSLGAGRPPITPRGWRGLAGAGLAPEGTRRAKEAEGAWPTRARLRRSLGWSGGAGASPFGLGGASLGAAFGPALFELAGAELGQLLLLVAIGHELGLTALEITGELLTLRGIGLWLRLSLRLRTS